MNKRLLILAAVSAATAFSVCAAPAYTTHKAARAAGVKAYKAKNYTAMQEAFAAAQKLTTHPAKIWDAVYHESRAYRQMKKWNEALKVLDVYLEKYPDAKRKGSALFIKGQVCASQKNNALAIKCFEEAAATKQLIGEEKYRNEYNLIKTYFSVKQFKKCEARAEEILKDPKYAFKHGTLFYVASCKYQQKKYAESVKLLQPTVDDVKNKMQKSMNAFLLAQSLDKLNKQEEANKYYKLVTELTPKFWRGRHSAALLKKRGAK